MLLFLLFPVLNLLLSTNWFFSFSFSFFSVLDGGKTRGPPAARLLSGLAGGDGEEI